MILARPDGIMAWFDVSDGQLEYRGRIDRAPFDAWLGTPEGSSALAAAASRLRFRFLGRHRAARRDIWKMLSQAARDEPLASALNAAAGDYLRAMSELPYAAGLPRTQVGLRRVVVVPRVMIAGRARTAVTPKISRSPALSSVDEAVLAFFLDEIIVQLDSAVQRARPTATRPVRGTQEWACVGIDTRYVWVDPYWSGPRWFGHVFLYEWPQGRVSRRDRKGLERALADLQEAVGTLSRERRHDLVRTAGTA
jgi:hypothetical protein